MYHENERNHFGVNGGTWLGITRTGRIATITNYCQKVSDFNPKAQGRGFLVVDYLCCDLLPEEYLKPLAQTRTHFNGYNILTIELKSGKVFYFSNMEGRDIQQLTPGIYGLSNKTVDYPWGKVVHGKQRFIDVLQLYQDSKEGLVEELLKMMSDDTCHHPGGNYPLLDWPEEYIKCSSSIFVKGFETPSGGYGTRTTSVILVDNKDHVTYVERTLDDPIEIGTYRWQTQQFEFDLLTST
ncbi:transport and Golgi organization protein 2 homolog [Corticium candelabrum]|uniref:transport and Golgi organization protein 2 homolog n=1 Tax=Corticium candelabrum TaxID=121492 RepID=UPI002E26E86E|nr:transport and Golgi organization protein 2 homolog [Corticium candelabrum]